MAAESTSSKPPQNEPLPPGMVMGPDGKPCKICTAFRNWKPRTDGQTSKKGSTSAMMSAFGAMVAPVAVPAAEKNPTDAPQYRSDAPPPNCPPDVEQLGQATWTFLHTTAAYYPEKPTPTQRANMLMLLRSLPVLYPCGWCADDFGKDMSLNPPDVSTRTSLSRWLCERHNAVNRKLGKSEFECARVDERWKDGPADGRCD